LTYSSVCAVDATSLQKGACVKLDSMPDGLAYVASVKEVWVTTPRDESITILDAANAGTIAVKTKMTFEGEPEGYAVDDERGIFYTNLDDKDRTLAIDIKARQVAKTWMPNCGEDGPKGLALDCQRNFLVACADRVKVLDAGRGGEELSAARPATASTISTMSKRATPSTLGRRARRSSRSRSSTPQAS
jgi:hypothetical protein